MPTLLHFLQNAHFPAPPTVIKETANSTDVSDVDIGLVADAWKARLAIRDNTLVDNLSDTLAQILGQTPLGAGELDAHFSPHLESEDADWRRPNDSEAKAIQLLNIGVNMALKRCARKYDPQLEVSCEVEEREGSSRSKVDMAIFVDNIRCILLEVKSPTVMEHIRNIIPLHGMKLRWEPGGPLLSKVFLKAAVYLGLRKLEWLFLTCHNSWIVFRLTKIRDEIVLAYSPMIDITNSSAPFLAFFGVLLSVVKKIPTKPTVFPVNLVLDTLPEEGDEEGPADPPSDGDHGNRPRTYRPSGGGGRSSDPPMTRSRRRAEGDSAGNSLLLTSSPAHASHSHWIQLHNTSNRSVALSFPSEWGRFLRITNLLGAGSTGGVYQGSIGNKNLAVKIVEILGPEDSPKRQRLQSEFGIYSLLELAFSSGKLTQRITPQCYGIFGSERLDALIMELHGHSLSKWDDLGSSEREQVFTLIKQLHSVGVLHGDLEPRNVVWTTDKGFVLIDFTESKTHTCPDSDHFDALVLHHPSQGNKALCAEIRCIQQVLCKRPYVTPPRAVPLS